MYETPKMVFWYRAAVFALSGAALLVDAPLAVNALLAGACLMSAALMVWEARSNA